MKKTLKEQLTDEVIVIIKRYEWKRFGEVYKKINEDVEEFLVSKGI